MRLHEVKKIILNYKTGSSIPKGFVVVFELNGEEDRFPDWGKHGEVPFTSIPEAFAIAKEFAEASPDCKNIHIINTMTNKVVKRKPILNEKIWKKQRI